MIVIFEGKQLNHKWTDILCMKFLIKDGLNIYCKLLAFNLMNVLSHCLHLLPHICNISISCMFMVTILVSCTM